MDTVLLFAAVGFCAQLIDASLGMGFGLISSSILLAGGVSPPLISAAVNAAKLPTGLVSALSHMRFGNIDRRVLTRLTVSGVATGVLGALLLSHLKSPAVVILVSVFLMIMGVLIFVRGILGRTPSLVAFAPVWAIGGAGGLIEGIGGSWGPIVTTGLLGAGYAPRKAVGSSCTAELAVSAAVFLTLMITFSRGHWGEDGGLHTVLGPVVGLIVGGLPAAVVGGYMASRIPRRPMSVAVGCLAFGIGLWRMLEAV